MFYSERCIGSATPCSSEGGILAIGEGFLDEDPLADVPDRRNRRRLLISRALIDRNIPTFDEMRRVLDESGKRLAFCNPLSGRPREILQWLLGPPSHLARGNFELIKKKYQVVPQDL